MKALRVMAIIGIVLSCVGILACWINVISFGNLTSFVDMGFYGFFLALSIMVVILTKK